MFLSCAVTITFLCLLVGVSIAWPMPTGTDNSAIDNRNSSKSSSSSSSTESSISSTDDSYSYVSSPASSVESGIRGSNSNSTDSRIQNSSASSSNISSSSTDNRTAGNTTPSNINSTAAGSSVTTPLTPNFEPIYAHSFAELLASLTAEFVFNVAGDHVLFPVAENQLEDLQLHTTAAIVAELLQRLHISREVHAVLNSTSHTAAERLRTRDERANPVAEAMRLTVDALLQHPSLRDEYATIKQRVDNQIVGLPRLHGTFASNRTQTLYDVTAEQQQYAERLMQDVRVKKLLMSVTFLKASQYEEVSAMPLWVRDQVDLAKAVFQLAKRPTLRDEVQRLFDETLIEILEKYDAMSDDDALIFQTLRRKFERNASLNAELEMVTSHIMHRTKTSTAT